MYMECLKHFWQHWTPEAPLTFFNDEGGGGPSDFFGPEILAKFWVYERCRDFFGLQEKQKQRNFYELRKED